MPWVKLKSRQQLTRQGEKRQYGPGDCVEVGRKTAVDWVLAGLAEDTFGQVEASLIDDDSLQLGLRVMAQEGSVSLEGIADFVERLQISWGFPELLYDYTCIWFPTRPLTTDLLNYGFLRLIPGEEEAEGWEMAASLLSLDKYASDIGTEEEKTRTKDALGDLRIPVYDARIIWARKTERAAAVISRWNGELKTSKDLNHSFIRALFTERAMLCTLPLDWTR